FPGTQTLYLLTPSILNHDPTDKKPKNEKSPVSLKHEFDPTGLVQRCVIIQRDENGFGLTVSGDNPVFVQLVKEGKVNGSLVTHSNHIEVVKLIKSGSYVALTVLGRPPGLPQIPLGEEEEEVKEDGAEVSTPSSLSAPHSPALPGGEKGNPACSPSLADGVSKKEDRNPRPKLLKEIQEVKKHISVLQEQLSKAVFQIHGSPLPESPGNRDTPCQSPDISRRDGLNFCSSPDTEETPDTESSAQCIVGSPPYLLNPQIIGAEDDYFDSQQEQINGPCSSFETLDLLKSRPAHLAVFLHHVVSQFDPVPLVCMQTHQPVDTSLERQVKMTDCNRKKLELIPEDVCKQYTQTLQDSLLPDLNKNLEDFRQKRSMGLTLAEDELSKLDSERGENQQVLEKECSCAEHILSKIEDILLTSQPTEEEKCQTMQYVILTYMKHLGVKVKEPRGLEHKRARINFLPKIKVRSEVKKSTSKRKKYLDADNTHQIYSYNAVEINKQRSPKQLPQPTVCIPEQSDSSSSSNSGRTRGNQLSEGSDTNLSPFCIQTRPSEGLQSGDHQDAVSSPTSTQFDFSPSNLEQLQEEDQDAFSSGDIQSEDDLGGEVEGSEEDPLNWQSLVSRGVLASLTPLEIKRQEVINELFYTERAHLRMLKVLDSVFYQRLSRDGILPPEDLKHVFINLEEIIQLHVSVTEQMTSIRKRSETSVIGQIADDLLAWFSGEEEEKIKRAVGTFCSNQPSALELIKSRKKKDQRFTLFMREAESNRLCRRLQLKDIIPVEMQRVTKYPLLLDNIAKYTEDGEEREKVRRAAECCKKILNHVNQAVKEAENKQRLIEYQRRLDISSLKQSDNPMILELKNLDLTKRKMVHEGPLSWKINKDKIIELYTLLLEDILVLLQKQDERLVLKLHGKNPASAADTKNIFSPVIKLNTVLVRPVATDNRSFFVLSMSENGAQIYKVKSQTVSDQRITNPFDGMKSEDEEEELEEEGGDEEIDEAELEAFLDGQLPFLQEETPQSVAAENQELNAFDSASSSKGEEALRTCKSHTQRRTLRPSEQIFRPKQNSLWRFKIQDFYLSHAHTDVQESRQLKDRKAFQNQTFNLTSSVCSASPPPGGFVVLDFGGSEESSTDDDGGVGVDVGIDMSKLLSSSSQTGGVSGPNLSRQLMTHLRLLQADLQYLKVLHMLSLVSTL
uniref:DH domain-containing protein n=1 Tax=Labrus bergylta TaxID=56723 RepID=A0A3Q3GVR9_9LABR